MVSALLFISLLFATVAAWCGNRELGISLFTVGLLGASAWFVHHMTTIIGLAL